MSKVKRKELVEKANDHELRLFQIEKALEQHGINWFAEEPKLKQLDQSVFNGLDEKWKSAATNTDGKAYLHNMPKSMMYFNHSSYGWCSKDYDAHEMQLIGDGFDPSGFAIGFIERDIAKELLEVDLSSELTGSDLARAMLARGDKYVMCANQSAYDDWPRAIALNERGRMYYISGEYSYDANDSIYPINNQGEPLTQSEVGL